MTAKLEEDYWNATSGFSFQFDDETEILKESNADFSTEDLDSVFNSSLEVCSLLPINSLISKQDLQNILDDVKLPEIPVVPPVEDPIRSMFFGEPVNLSNYRTLDDKISLLDKAVESCDGNIILKVVLFLTKSLKANIVYRHFLKRPIALQQYANYLTNCNRTHDLELLYTATGNKSNLSTLFYLSTKRTSVNNVQKKLNQFSVEYLDNIRDDYEKSIFNYHKKFIQFKLEQKLEGETPITVLANLLASKLEKGDILTDPQVVEFVKMLKITEFQLEWILINLVAAKEMWPKINDLFFKANWFTKKTMVKSNINSELIINGLYKHGAPKHVLEIFLASIADVDRATYLGRKLKCYKFVIETLTAKKDRLALINYKEEVPHQSEFVVMIDNILSSHDKRWIN